MTKNAKIANHKRPLSPDASSQSSPTGSKKNKTEVHTSGAVSDASSFERHVTERNPETVAPAPLPPVGLSSTAPAEQQYSPLQLWLYQKLILFARDLAFIKNNRETKIIKNNLYLHLRNLENKETLNSYDLRLCQTVNHIIFIIGAVERLSTSMLPDLRAVVRKFLSEEQLLSFMRMQGNSFGSGLKTELNQIYMLMPYPDGAVEYMKTRKILPESMVPKFSRALEQIKQYYEAAGFSFIENFDLGFNKPESSQGMHHNQSSMMSEHLMRQQFIMVMNKIYELNNLRLDVVSELLTRKKGPHNLDFLKQRAFQTFQFSIRNKLKEAYLTLKDLTQDPSPFFYSVIYHAPIDVRAAIQSVLMDILKEDKGRES
jgi:hypothetical protein